MLKPLNLGSKIIRNCQFSRNLFFFKIEAEVVSRWNLFPKINYFHLELNILIAKIWFRAANLFTATILFAGYQINRICIMQIKFRKTQRNFKSVVFTPDLCFNF